MRIFGEGMYGNIGLEPGLRTRAENQGLCYAFLHRPFLTILTLSHFLTYVNILYNFLTLRHFNIRKHFATLFNIIWVQKIGKKLAKKFVGIEKTRTFVLDLGMRPISITFSTIQKFLHYE